MKLVALVCLCLVTRCGITAAGVNGPGVINVAVEEGSDVVLLCSLSTKDDIEKMVFDWKKDDQKEKEVFFYQAGKHYNNGRGGQSKQFKGRVSHFQDELKYGNASIKLQNTEMSDSGNYTCTFPNKQTSHITLVVDPDPERSVLKDRTGENITGAARVPCVTILGPTEDGMLLQCRVHGASPKPHVQWQDKDGNNLTAEEPQVSKRERSYDVTLNVTVTKTDHYRCVATQETIYHQIHSEIYVPLNGDRSEGNSESSTGSVGWTVLGIVLFVGGVLAVLVAVLRSKGCITLNWNKDEENTRNSPDANSGASLPLKSTDNN